MLIHPKRSGRTPPPVRVEGEAAPLIVAIGLALEVAHLYELSEWEPVGVLLEEIPLAVRGEGSLSHREVARLRTWARNWGAITEDVRAFYVANHSDSNIQSALWYVLGTAKNRPPSWPVNRAYSWAVGHEPAIDLLPKPQETT